MLGSASVGSAGVGIRSSRSSGHGEGFQGDGIAMMHGTGWNLLRAALSMDEQIRLFRFIHERDATDWGKLMPCMNPTPKTLEFDEVKGVQSRRSLSCNPDDKTAVVEMVMKAIEILQWRKVIKSMTVSAIRYCGIGENPCIGSCFPAHIDHCNDRSIVVLFSLGRTARFHVQDPGMDQRHTFNMNSGDILVFDPSSEAAIVHGVAGVLPYEEETSKHAAEMGAKFDHLRSSRFGVQCRVILTQ